MYFNFIYLHVATKICLKSEFKPYYDIARKLFVNFVETFDECYGSNLMSSNVHNVVHLVDCAERFGNLDEFSTFPYETFLGQLKSLIKKNQQELQQVAKRLIESGGILDRQRSTNCEILLLKQSYYGNKQSRIFLAYTQPHHYYQSK